MSYHVTICHNHIVSYDTLVFMGKSHEFRILSPCSQHFCWYLPIFVAIPVVDPPPPALGRWPAARGPAPRPAAWGRCWRHGPAAGDLRIFTDASGRYQEKSWHMVKDGSRIEQHAGFSRREFWKFARNDWWFHKDKTDGLTSVVGNCHQAPLRRVWWLDLHHEMAISGSHLWTKLLNMNQAVLQDIL